MKYIKLFEDYNKYELFLRDKGFEINSYKDIFKYTPKQIVDYLGYEGFDSETDAIKYLKELLKTDFPKGFRNIPKTILLYRIVALENIENLDVENLGIHFVSEKDILDQNFLDTIGLEDLTNMTGNDYNLMKIYILTIETNIESIDFFQTLNNRLTFPIEKEITTYNNMNAKILNIKEIKKVF
jgi:hypothetical protein